MFTTQQCPLSFPNPQSPSTLPHPLFNPTVSHIPYFQHVCLSTDLRLVNRIKQNKSQAILRKMVGKKRQNYKKSKRNKHAYNRKLSKQIADTQQPLDFIVNLSDIPLTNTQRAVLNKGLKFIPTPNNPTIQPVVESFLDFQQRMMLRYHFRYVNNLETIPIFRTKSDWKPPNYQHPAIQEYLHNILNDICKLCNKPQPNTPNFSKDEIKALNELKQRNDIVIKPADKGGKIVLWPAPQYLNEAHKQLSDTQYYTRVDKDHTPETALEIDTFLCSLKYKYKIDDELYDFLSPVSLLRTPIFYLLPKIHKPNIPGRPIISGCDSPTSRLSIFLDYYLKPIVSTLPSFIKDTNHFLQMVLDDQLTIPEGATLVTLDVKALRTSIPHDEGIGACLKATNDHYHNDPPLSLHYLKQMMEFILKRNYFDFNGEHFLQTMGTAMGTGFAPNYANIYMVYFEQKALSKAPNNLQPLIWKRFIDDIFFIWTHGGTALQGFYDYLNTIHPTIKFEISHSIQEIDFLDTTIFFKHGTKLESTLFVKSIDTCSLLHATSFHPDSCKSSVIYSQALRYCSIITDHTKLKEQLDILKENLLRRGYQLSEMHKNFRKATQYSQSELLNRSNFPETKKQILPFITHYNNTNIQISGILRTHWHIIQDDPTVNWLWHQPPILAMKRNKNLKDFLVHTNLVISTPPKP